MKPSLVAGLTRSEKVTVDETRVIGFMGDDCRVYATPKIISDGELACRRLLLEHLDPGEDSVGTRISVEHVGPGLFGVEVTINVKLVAIDGRRVSFEVSVDDGQDPIARGTFERFVVSVDRTRERLLKKKAQLAQRGAGA